MRIATFVLAIVAAAAAFTQPRALAQTPAADLVVRNALIWTGDEANPEATAAAIRDGRFVAVGADAEVRAHIGRGTRVIDADGKRVLPGLIDAHVHLAGAASSLGRLDLRPARSREHLLSMLEEHARTLGPDDWVLGRGWSAESWPEQRPPTAEEIDQATGGRPAALVRMDGHSLIAGATALRIAGIDQHGPPDPPGGKIGRYEDGRPDGAIYEQAMSLVTRHAPSETPDRTRRLFRRAVARANELGVTQVGAIDSQRFFEAFVAPLDRAGDLTLRVHGTVSEGHGSIEAWRPTLEWAASHTRLSPRVRILGFKGYMDGSLGSRTAWMHGPYLDNPRDEDNAGFPLALAETGELDALISLAASLGLQPAVHAIGDRANHVLLDWYEKIPDALRRKVRPRIEHAQHLTSADVGRFAELGVIPSMQPLHKADDGRYAEQRIGPERIQTSYAFRDLLDSGATLAFGSDWPVVSVNPFLGIHAAVTGRTLDGATFVPSQSISVEEALRCYTRHAAHALHSEDETGMIRVGHRGDLVMLDRDVLTVAPDRIDETKALLTVVGGGVAHEAE